MVAYRSLTTEALMATANDTGMTLLSQGKFIRTSDRFAIEAKARALRAAAVHDLVRAALADIRRRLTRVGSAPRSNLAPHQTA